MDIKNSSIAVAKVAGKGILKHVLLIGFSILVFVVAVFLVASGDGPGVSASGHAGIAGAILGLIYLFVIDFWPMLLCVSSLLLFPFLYFTLINKNIIQESIFKLWKNNLEAWFLEKITSYSNKFFSDGTKLSELDNRVSLKLGLINNAKNDKTNSKWQRKILSFVIKKIKLDDFDSTAPDAKLSDHINTKAIEFVSELGQPSSKPLLIVFGTHVVLLILAVVFNN